MLGVYNSELEKISKTCGPRLRAGVAVQVSEYIPIAKQALADMTDEDHELEFAYEYGQPSVSLAKIVAYLEPGQACFLAYGRVGAGGHAVVLRKNQDGIIELVDPQRGSDYIGKEYGFTAGRAAELGIEATPQYYRVQGIPAIEAVMIEQSVLFNYWPSKKELLADLAHFRVGALMIDSVAGLKMLIDDPTSTALATKMEEDEEYPPPPEPSSSKMEIDDMQGGAGKTLPPETFAKLWKDHNDAIEKEMDILIGKLKVDDVNEINKVTLLKQKFLERINKISWKDGEDIHLGPTEFIQRFFQLGPAEISAILSVKGDTNPDSDYEEEGGEEEEASDDGSTKPGSTGSTATVRKHYETIAPISQCKKAEALGANVTNYCYICGFEILDTKNPKFNKGKKKAPHNTRECEHILPAFTALGHGGLITKSSENTSTDPNIVAIFKTEYANSHRCCNQIKSASIWIKYNPTKPFSVSVDRQELSKTLRKIERSDKYDCKAVLGALGRDWAEKRADFIEKNVLNPLVQSIMNNMDPEPELYYARFRYRQVKSIAGLTPEVLASVFLGTGDAAKLAAEALDQVRKSQKKYPAAKIGPLLKELLIPDILRLNFQEIFKTMTVGISFDEILTTLTLRNPTMRAPRNLEKYLFDLLDKKKIAAIVTSAITKLGTKGLNEDEITTLENNIKQEIDREFIRQLKVILGPKKLISESGVEVVEDKVGGGGDEELGNLDDAFDSLIAGVSEDIAEADVDLKTWLASPAYLGTRSRGPAPDVKLGDKPGTLIVEGVLKEGLVADLVAGESSKSTKRGTEGGQRVDISVHQGGRRVVDVEL
jgi:hypothetical protein